MTNLNEQLIPRQARRLKILLFWFLASAFVGFLDSAYLSVKHFIGSPVTCGFFTGCDIVTSSSYSAIAGIPIALIGALYYLTWVILGVWYLDSRNSLFFTFLPLTSVGFLASLILIGIQVFVIHAICLYCVLSAATSTSLFVVFVLIRRAEYDDASAISHPSNI